MDRTLRNDTVILPHALHVVAAPEQEIHSGAQGEQVVAAETKFPVEHPQLTDPPLVYGEKVPAHVVH